MADFSSWFQDNWPDVIMALGVIGSFWIGIVTSNRDNARNERESLERAAERHSRLWSQMTERESLARILKEDADVLKQPVTTQEEEFINGVMVHFMVGWQNLCKQKSALEEFVPDVKKFFSLPLPRAVWEKTKQYRNKKFVQFVDQALEDARRLRMPGA